MCACLNAKFMYNQVSISAVKWVCLHNGECCEKNGCIFRLASMQWDSTLQGLAASQTPLLPWKRAAAWHPRGATQFNHFWPFSVAGFSSLCLNCSTLQPQMQAQRTHTQTYAGMYSYSVRCIHALWIRTFHKNMLSSAVLMMSLLSFIELAVVHKLPSVWKYIPYK